MAEMTQQEDESDFDTVDELAEFFRVSPSSIRRAINKSQVRAFRIGGSIRIPRAERERLSISDPK
jgi:excisionase family DNA binding protein